MKKGRTWNWLYHLEKSKTEHKHAICSTNRKDVTKTLSTHDRFFSMHSLAGTTRITLFWIEYKVEDTTPSFLGLK